ncbi:hypothetical protein MUO32_05185 [Shinella sp. CPCC 101442]|uniref:hypothetical protein n=1 Tax=Shinella sp. CPCC 101442 TaxID=2932265 RepID=UPI0021526E91|nr:hypothetical protein [Shinella sp. CPCC 101442]MCR6498421.1 hypothetical protein [Shinella sp. CPCC 101442]
MSYTTKVYTEQGGNRQTIAPGGSLKVGNAIFTVDANSRVIVTGLPTANPNVAGALWSNSGVLTLSAG